MNESSCVHNTSILITFERGCRMHSLGDINIGKNILLLFFASTYIYNTSVCLSSCFFEFTRNLDPIRLLSES